MIFAKRLNTKKNMGNECYYYSLEKILPVVLYGCETWSLMLREEHRLRVLENKVLRKIFGTKTKLQENRESYIMLSFMHCILHLT